MTNPRCGRGWSDDERREPLSWSWEEPLLIKDAEEELCAEKPMDHRRRPRGCFKPTLRAEGTQGMPWGLKSREGTERRALWGSLGVGRKVGTWSA